MRFEVITASTARKQRHQVSLPGGNVKFGKASILDEGLMKRLNNRIDEADKAKLELLKEEVGETKVAPETD